MVQEITDINFKKIVLDSNQLVLIDFWAPWCKPCMEISSKISELSKEYEGKALIVKINVDNNPNTVNKYSIQSIPTLLLLKKGEEKYRQIGISSNESLRSKLNMFL